MTTTRCAICAHTDQQPPDNYHRIVHQLQMAARGPQTAERYQWVRAATQC